MLIGMNWLQRQNFKPYKSIHQNLLGLQ